MSRNRPADDSGSMGLENALEWAKLPPEHLRAALRALEPELQRQHLERGAARQNSYKLSLFGLIAGFLLCAGMLSGSIVVGMHGQTWLAGVLAGPSMIGVIGVFVLRTIDVRSVHPGTAARSPKPPPIPGIPEMEPENLGG